MKEIDRNRKLGRGLSALIGDVSKRSPSDLVDTENLTKQDNSQEKVRNIEVSKIIAGSCQPRRNFDYDKLLNLSESIKQNGIIQPIVTRAHPTKQGMFEIIVGERRFRASIMAGLKEVPAIIRAIKDSEALELAIIENIQRGRYICHRRGL